ncbi:MAG TPA: TRAP transporter small permease [Hyphomicrobiaceae bacterium]|nr:TRAP transporter small permease [Hyphomicrobiaceae bacterium]
MFEKIWGIAEDTVIGVFSAIALMLICYEVVVRYFFPTYLTDWGSEVVIYLVVWAMLIAGSPLVLQGRHIRADLIVRMLPNNGQWILELVNLIVGLLYCALVAKFALDVVLFARNLGEQSESSLQFPLWIFYIALPLSFGLMALRYVFRLYRFIFHFDPNTMLGEHDDGAVEDRIRKSQT